ncbi:hypothetical protein SprV_0602209500 [Sparganum proliferum]
MHQQPNNCGFYLHKRLTVVSPSTSKSSITANITTNSGHTPGVPTHQPTLSTLPPSASIILATKPPHATGDNTPDARQPLPFSSPSPPPPVLTPSQSALTAVAPPHHASA